MSALLFNGTISFKISLILGKFGYLECLNSTSLSIFPRFCGIRRLNFVLDLFSLNIFKKSIFLKTERLLSENYTTVIEISAPLFNKSAGWNKFITSDEASNTQRNF